MFYYIVAIVIGYFIGAIPFGLIYVKLFTGKDIRQVGSGRMGGTNSLRAGGWGVGFATALSDVLKGAMALLITTWVVQNQVSTETLPWVQITAGIFAVIGHNWSVFYGFKGGAGTGPNVGWAAAVWFPMFPIAFAIMFSLIYFLGIASVASMIMGLIIPIGFGIIYYTGSDVVAISSPAYMVGGIITAAIVAFALRGNFQRLLRGEERVVGLRAKRKQKREQEAAEAAAEGNR